MRRTPFIVLCVLLLCSCTVYGALEEGFVPLFDGKSLDGWQQFGQSGRGYVVDGGMLVCPEESGGSLFTTGVYGDFALRFDFRLQPGANNGVAIRTPLGGHGASEGMEIQILDDSHPMYSKLEPGQYHGSIYKVAPAKRGSLKKPGEWNTEEIIAVGRRVMVKVNGKTVVDADLNTIRDPKVVAEHPGFLRDAGHIAFLGHRPARVEFRNIRIKRMDRRERDNRPPAGFTALFNGRDLTGWKGLVANPPERAKMEPRVLKARQAEADRVMREHWKVVDGVLDYDGKGDSLCTAKDYGDFEMLVDWKIEPDGDSGIYLRGTPQVQIWQREEGSGGLYNNQKNPSKPLKNADRPPGEWNTFRIIMIGEKVTVFLNSELVVRDVTMENYWERDKPIYPVEQLELQHHNSRLFFKNIYIREIKSPGSSGS